MMARWGVKTMAREMGVYRWSMESWASKLHWWKMVAWWSKVEGWRTMLATRRIVRTLWVMIRIMKGHRLAIPRTTSSKRVKVRDLRRFQRQRKWITERSLFFIYQLYLFITWLGPILHFTLGENCFLLQFKCSLLFLLTHFFLVLLSTLKLRNPKKY